MHGRLIISILLTVVPSMPTLSAEPAVYRRTTLIDETIYETPRPYRDVLGLRIFCGREIERQP